MTKVHKIFELATAEFGELKALEKELFRAVVNGEIANFDNVHKWGSDPTIEANRIAWLCLNQEVRSLIAHKGLDIYKLTINGKLSLEFASVNMPIRFGFCKFADEVSLINSKFPALNFYESTFQSLFNGAGIKVDGSVLLRCNTFQSEVRFIAATIGGNLECDGSTFLNPGGLTLSAERVNVGGNIFLCRYKDGREFNSDGEVSLVNAKIGVALKCEGGKFRNEDDSGISLNAEALNVSDSVFLNKGFVSCGCVRLVNATIGKSLLCEAGLFNNTNGISLNASAAKITSIAHFQGSKFQGELRLVRTNIEGSLDCRGTHLTSEDIALNGDGIRVSGHVFLSNGFEAIGKVHLVSANIARGLNLTEIRNTKEMILDLRFLHVGFLADDKQSWPSQNNLLLNGFSYGFIEDVSPIDVKSRLEWLHLQPHSEYSVQPYEQLAKVLLATGHDRKAKEILIAKEKDRGRWADLSRSVKFWHWILGAVIDYGYRPLKAWRYIGFIVILGAFVFDLFHPELMIPVDPSQSPSLFNSFVYSLDTFLPVIDLHQESLWTPHADKIVDLNTLSVSLFGWQLEVPKTWSLNVSGRTLRYYYWFHIVAGWFLTSMLVAGLTGLVKR
jgi:hypothetical protein